MDELIEILKKVLASNFALYLKSHQFHWNIEGPDFDQLHNMFGRQYQDLWENVDTIAEKIRMLDAFAPGSFERYLELTEIQSELKIPNAIGMVAKLIEDHEKMVVLLNQAFIIAQKVNDQAIMNYLAERLDAHKKHRWQLVATSKIERGFKSQ